MFKKQIIKIVGLLLLAQSWVFAQQDPQYTQYMYNMSVVNPAYTTNDLGRLNFGGLYRSQWKNAVGAPETLTFFCPRSGKPKYRNGYLTGQG